MKPVSAWKSRARGFMRFSMGIMCSSGTLAPMSIPRMMPGRPFPYTRNSSCSGSVETQGQPWPPAGPGQCRGGGTWHRGCCGVRERRAHGSSPLPPVFPPGRPALTFAGLPVAAQAEPGAAAAGPALVAVPEQADVRAASRLPKLIRLAGVAPNCNTERGCSARGHRSGTGSTGGQGHGDVGMLSWVLPGF